MRGTVSKYRIRLKPKQRVRLNKVVRRRKPSHWLVVRARVVLLSHEGRTVFEICSALSLDRQVVRRWCKRFHQLGFDGLKDRPRAGRPAQLKPALWQKVATVIVQPPTKFGLPYARWSVRELSRFLDGRYRMTVSRSSLSRFLRAMSLKPHRIKYWLNPADPDFDQKAAAICQIYLAPPPKTTVLCIDEKPGIQALSRRFPARPLSAGCVPRIEFEYRRHGTRNVFAAFNVVTGHVFTHVTEDRSTARVIDFLDDILRLYRRGPLLLITDNIHTRRGEPARRWLQRHPRVSFVFTPYHGSWLNQVEIWFGILTSKCLRARSFSSVAELSDAIYSFAEHWNTEMAKPFEWTYTGKVLAA
jgi:transposase